MFSIHRNYDCPRRLRVYVGLMHVATTKKLISLFTYFLGRRWPLMVGYTVHGNIAPVPACTPHQVGTRGSERQS